MVGCLAHLAICCRQKRRHIAARRGLQPVTNNAVLCAMSGHPVPHSHRVTRRHVGQWLPPSPCSLMRDGWMRSVYQSILHSVIPGNVRSSLCNLSRDSLHDDTSAPPPPSHTLLHRFRAPTASNHTPHSSARRVQPRILPLTHTRPRFALMTEVFLEAPARQLQ